MNAPHALEILDDLRPGRHLVRNGIRALANVVGIGIVAIAKWAFGGKAWSDPGRDQKRRDQRLGKAVHGDGGFHG